MCMGQVGTLTKFRESRSTPRAGAFRKWRALALVISAKARNHFDLDSICGRADRSLWLVHRKVKLKHTPPSAVCGHPALRLRNRTARFARIMRVSLHVLVCALAAPERDPGINQRTFHLRSASTFLLRSASNKMSARAKRDRGLCGKTADEQRPSAQPKQHKKKSPVLPGPFGTPPFDSVTRLRCPPVSASDGPAEAVA